MVTEMRWFKNAKPTHVALCVVLTLIIGLVVNALSELLADSAHCPRQREEPRRRLWPCDPVRPCGPVPFAVTE